MDKDQLQQKIAEYYAKLPPKMQEIFAKMEWMEVLKGISAKYNLKEEEISSLGTETTLLLLGIIHPDEYINFLEKEITVSEDIKVKIGNEINEKVLTMIRGDLESAHLANTLELGEAEMNSTADVPLPPYLKNLNKTNKNKIDDDIPRPQVLPKIPEGLPVMQSTQDKKEEDIFKKADMEILEQKKIDLMQRKEKKFSIGEDRILVDSGIAMVEERPIVEKEHLLPNTETQKSVLSGIEHPQAGRSSILGEKLGGSMSEIQKTTDYSTPQTSTPSNNPAPQKPKDPYHEEIE